MLKANEKQSNLYIETDKRLAPFLLAASFQKLITVKGNYTDHGILHWIFSPKDKAQFLVEKFLIKSEPHIPAQDLFIAIEAFWEQIAKYKKYQMENRKT